MTRKMLVATVTRHLAVAAALTAGWPAPAAAQGQSYPFGIGQSVQVSGTIVDPYRRPVSGLKIAFLPQGWFEDGKRMAVTGGNGRFTVRLQVMNYQIMAFGAVARRPDGSVTRLVINSTLPAYRTNAELGVIPMEVRTVTADGIEFENSIIEGAERESAPVVMRRDGTQIPVPGRPPENAIWRAGVDSVPTSRPAQAQGRWVGRNYYELLNNQWVLRGQMFVTAGRQYFRGSASTLPAGDHLYLISNGHWYMQVAGGWQMVR